MIRLTRSCSQVWYYYPASGFGKECQSAFHGRFAGMSSKEFNKIRRLIKAQVKTDFSFKKLVSSKSLNNRILSNSGDCRTNAGCPSFIFLSASSRKLYNRFFNMRCCRLSAWFRCCSSFIRLNKACNNAQKR